MKNLLLALLLFTSLNAFSQNYKPFNASSKKLFAAYPEMNTTYSMAFDSVLSVGNDSVYYNFFGLPWELNFVSYDCEFWPGPECFRQNIPVWVGAKIEFDNLYSYNFYPGNGETIHLNFNPVFGEPSIFYQDDVQKFLLSYEGADTLTTLNHFDSVRFFEIHHQDINGNTINSDLNGKNIVLTKNLGLTQFFQVDSFPQVLKPLHLIGNKNSNLGITKITNEMVYDYQQGDEIQYREYHYYENGPPWENFTLYRKHKILNRTQTTTHLNYQIEEETFYTDSSFVLIDTITKSYSRYTTIAQLPFEVFDGNYKQFYLGDYCDFKFWTYDHEEENGLGYCETDNVWGPIDTNGAPDDDEITYVFGLGIYRDHYNNAIPGSMWHDGHYKYIIYFKKNDIACGDLIVGIEEPGEISAKVIVSPNPASSEIRFTSDVNLKRIILVNSNGKVLLTEKPNGNKTIIDVSRFSDGIYFAKIEFEGNRVLTKKIVVLR